MPVALKAIAKCKKARPAQWQSFDWRGLHFPNRLGVAGGLDKDASFVKAWWALGAGFVEVGTITLKAQRANQGRIIDRDVKQEALWNRMGFPNKGSDYALKQLSRLGPKRATPIFINIGKNRHTPIENATVDYINLIRKFKSVADAFVINVSSPNTSGLRDLQEPKTLMALLTACLDESSKDSITPVFIKLSPDIEYTKFNEILDVCISAGVHGFILTNTTLSRSSESRFPLEGGVSGRPLAETSKLLLKQTISHLGERRKGKLIISVGGILSKEDVLERLKMGADLVQIYSALVFRGPGFFKEVAKELK